MENKEEPIEFNFQNPDRVGTDLRKLRESLRVGQRELARTLGMSGHVALSRVENGKYTPKFEKICEYIGGIEKAYRSKVDI